MKSVLLVVGLCLASCMAMAVTPGADGDLAVVTETLLASLFGESKAANVLAVVGIVLGVWAQVRMLIPPKWLAWLPGWFVALLEFLAGNGFYAKNGVSQHSASRGQS